MNLNQRLFTVLTLAIMAGIAGHCLAQPDPNNAPKAANPQNRDRANGDRQNQDRQNRRRGNNRDQAVATRAARLSERRAQNVTRLMSARGFTDKKMQEAVVNFCVEVDTAREPLRQASLKLRATLRNQAMKDAEVGILVNDYKAAQEDYAERRRQAEAKLDQQIGYTKKPRLHSILILGGVLGDVEGRAPVR